MTDQLERDLIQMFGRQADEIDIPPVPVDLLDAPAPKPGRGRVLAIVAAAAAVVAAVSIPIGLAARDGDEVQPAPAPTSPQVNGAPAIDVPYLLHGELRVGRLSVPTDATSIVVSGDELFVGSGEGAGVRWQRLVGDSLQPAAYLDGRFGIVVSPDGGLVAAPTGDGRSTATIWDTDSGDEVDTIRLSDPSEGNERWLYDFDADGRLYWQDGADLRMRSTTGEEVAVDDSERSFVGPAPGGIVLVTADANTASVVSVRDDGSALDQYDVPVTTAGVWDDAGQLSYADGGSLYVVLPQIGADVKEIPVEGVATLQPLGWSDGRVVVMSYGSAENRVLLIDPATGESEELFTVAADDDAYAFPAVGGTGAL
ncbi:MULTISPECIES: hypothetical protein [unclassified Nocardioides]|uniref:hypothetical protein n=1 Tax=unclassified Nocardioides TaxID=2615069 RepID=UPI0006F77754|nr:MULTISPECIES: hypothetical protein [unclassified Nocardioides]KRA32600.1 hypothetical protein ASD81_13755 [Nocardioides sp. Root614]KRA89253.1 hypothetical protein ASD84_14020 [Nocardioides sp. Root682]